ncbi:C-terminal binding protein [Ramlibacter tataouinensis]|uniref:D-3-phosphoglycerate dehydrogenase (Phosphoglycerate dehydrogenase)-like protein n=1 Tax=Ramlibacter tataouinensis (strain ATCC BAA-407 / DSM 14655 / LMG 21543 / TTB310) TaxID=365046 RepID=F5Y0Z0_RAMTT|nr:C-terminal binding protein [Ramlibacter tataouinensis]AEG92208.1 D-3-phosphoglycerate dehydrogenase (Phosphoglycerate dehydrogenase)-like protein [Ramlibacter tataouinensis TTB310]
MSVTAPRLVVALDDGYATYDQETELLATVGARFELRPCRGDEAAATRAVRGADVVLVRESPVRQRVIEAMDRCQAVIRYGIGVDNIDLAAAARRRIAVGNVPDYGTDEVSTQAVALALAVVRQLRLHDAEVRAGRWSTGVLRPLYRLRGRTLGLVGYGRIARMTHEKFAGFGFGRVLVSDPHAQLPPGAERAEVDEICREADVISLHAPLTPQTRHLIDARRLALMRPTAILVNTARGRLVDMDALCAALQAGRLLGAGLDVLETEPPDPAHPLFALDNLVVTNHIGWYSEEAMRDLQRKAAQEAVRVLEGRTPQHWLNPW